MDPLDGTPAMLVRWWILHSPFCRRKNQMQLQGRPLKISAARFFLFPFVFSFPTYCLGYDLGVYITQMCESLPSPRKKMKKVPLESHFASTWDVKNSGLDVKIKCPSFKSPPTCVVFFEQRLSSSSFQASNGKNSGANLSFVFYTLLQWKIWTHDMKMVIPYSNTGVSTLQ